jgi:hypothetical protein
VSTSDDRRSVSLPDGTVISLAPPPGWDVRWTATGTDSGGRIETVQLNAPASEVQVDVSFFSDPAGKISTRPAIEAELKRRFSFYLESSVEKQMAFTDLGSPSSVGAFTVFTEQRLVGKKIPENERLLSTTGIRSWKGGYLLFTILSNSRETNEYGLALELVRTGITVVAPKQTAARGAAEEGLTVAAAPWRLRVLDAGMKLTLSQVKPDGRSAYFSMLDETTGMSLSLFIEPATKCKTSRQCRDMVRKAGFANIGKVENVDSSEIGEVSVVECFLPELHGEPIRQQHLFAEFVQDGFWVDAHISRALYTPADRSRFVELVRSLRFERKD